jgi:hypothetical protein
MKQINDPNAWLCHYTRAHTAFARVLPSGRLLMNRYNRMRDPLENKEPFFAGVSGWSSDKDSDFQVFWQLQAAVRRARHPWRLVSLTQGQDTGRPPEGGWNDVFRCPWARPRMWEQYAENHAGVCLIFDREKLIDVFQYELAKLGQHWNQAVTYTPAGFAGSPAAHVQSEAFKGVAIEDGVAIHVYEHFTDFFFLKTEDWATECEYRFVLKPASDDGSTDKPLLVPYGDALKYVVVGEAFPPWQIEGARQVAKDARVELRFMSWKLGQPWPAVSPAPTDDERTARSESEPDAIPTQPSDDPSS